MANCRDCGGEAIIGYYLCESCATARRDAFYKKCCENCGEGIYGNWYLCNACYRKLVLGKG